MNFNDYGLQNKGGSIRFGMNPQPLPVPIPVEVNNQAEIYQSEDEGTDITLPAPQWRSTKQIRH